MDFTIPSANETLGKSREIFLHTFSTSCRRSIVEMVKNSQSGHPGGSLSALDILATLYAFRLTETDEKIVISNGHISPAVYSVLAECGVINKEDVVANFRKFGSQFEGHVSRHIPGIHFGTGPLGVGISAAVGTALVEKRNSAKKTNPPNPLFQGGASRRVFCMVGDGEMQEGQVHEAALLAAQEKLNNFTVFVDYNNLQISGTLDEVCSIDVAEFFRSKNWDVLEIDGHNFAEIWSAINHTSDKPVAVVAKTIMGKGVEGMEQDGIEMKPKWHGSTPKPDVADEMLAKLVLSDEEKAELVKFRENRNFQPQKGEFREFGVKMSEINTGTNIVYKADELTDCRGAYGKALLDLAQKNPRIMALTADLGGSVMTKFVAAELPAQFVECGIAEQNMVSAAGGMSLMNKIPFASTFGAFISSRAKDQARVNDINECNTKLVATHCGLSVGEDGPTHQAIDDAGSFLGMFNTGVIEPADPNHCDRIIRYIASHWGNFYVRMGRAKLPTLTKEDGTPFFAGNYEYKYGQTDILREGSEITIVATGPCVQEALKAREKFANPEQVEIVIISSIKKFDQTLLDSLKKTGKFITVEDHNPYSGLAAAVSKLVIDEEIPAKKVANLAVTAYELSGKAPELYHHAKIDSEAILEQLKVNI